MKTKNEKYTQVVEARAQDAALKRADEMLDGIGICRDDRCTRVELHAAHPIADDAADPFYDAAYPFRCGRERHGETLREIIYTHIPARYCKPFRDLYDDVCEDYGYVVSRAVYRALKVLLESEQVVNLTSAGIGKKLPGGYVRSNSPLLHDPDGMACLMETLEDARPAMVR